MPNSLTPISRAEACSVPGPTGTSISLNSVRNADLAQADNDNSEMPVSVFEQDPSLLLAEALGYPSKDPKGWWWWP